MSDVYIAQDDNGSRGFGFVRMDTEEGVAKVLSPEPLPYGKLGLLIFCMHVLLLNALFGASQMTVLAPCRHWS